MTIPIQTVHGVCHPVVVQPIPSEPAEAEESTTTQLYRDETAARLIQNNKKATVARKNRR
ncbi:hypothetical protein [Neorhodopirellula pilleata]|nr:hypothetical protein [Neorhodopirellula pilleata]